MASLLTRLWAWCTRRPATALLLAVAFHTLPVLGVRDLWVGDEVRHGAALRGVMEHGHIWVLEVAGRPYPDKPPLWFLGVGAIAWLAGSTAPWVFFLAAAIAALLLVRATWGMARHVAGLGPEAALAPALAASATPLVLLLSRTTRMDLLFAAFISVGLTALFRGLFARQGARHTVAGFAWGALACWTKGPLGLALPLATVLAALAWRGRLWRLLAADVLLGLLAALGIVGAWAAAVALERGPGFLKEVLSTQVAGRFLDASHHREPFWFYLAVLPPVMLPWSLLPLTFAWHPRTWGPRLRALVKGRHAGHDGWMWLGAIVASGIVVLSVTSMKFFIYLAPLLPPLLIFSTSAFAAVSCATRARFGMLLGGALLLAAVAVPLSALHAASKLTPVSLLPVAAAFGLAAWMALGTRRAAAGPLILASTLALSLVTLVGSATVAPRLDALGSPRGVATRIMELEAAGWQPLVYGVYSGTFAYHAARPVTEARGLEEVEAHVAASARPLVIVPARRVQRVRDRCPALRVLEEHPSLEGSFVLLERDPGLETPPR